MNINYSKRSRDEMDEEVDPLEHVNKRQMGALRAGR